MDEILLGAQSLRWAGADPILALVPAKAGQTLIAHRVGKGAYIFDVRLQGENETVFFEA